MNEPDHPTIGTKLLATVETAFRAFMVGKDAPPLQPADSTQAAWERFKACLMVAESSAAPVAAASLAARTVTLYCRCTLHVRPDGSGSGVVTDPRCEIHGTKPAPIVTALRAGMPWAEAAEKFGTMTNPNDTMRTLPSGRVVDLTKMTVADIVEAHNAGVIDLGAGIARVVGESAITFDLSPAAAKGTIDPGGS